MPVFRNVRHCRMFPEQGINAPWQDRGPPRLNLLCVRRHGAGIAAAAGDFRGLLLLHPVAGAIDQMTADHVGAGFRLHRFVNTER